jgi:hypothetical protein
LRLTQTIRYKVANSLRAQSCSRLLNSPAKIRPSWWYSLLAFPGALIGIALFAFFLWSGIQGVTAALTQVVVPGRVALNITQPGTYTIFLEQPSELNGKTYSSTEPVDALKCNLNVQPPSQTGTESALTPGVLRRPAVDLNYSTGNRAGRSVFEFQADQVALYHLNCDYPEGTHGPRTVFAVGTGVGARILKTVFRSFWGCLLEQA